MEPQIQLPILTATDRIKIYKQKREECRKRKRREYFEKEKERVKKDYKCVSKAALIKRNQRLKCKEKEEKINDKRLKTRKRVRKYRENKKNTETTDKNVTETAGTPFKNRMIKYRYLSRFKENLPKTPLRRSALISAYLDSNSPTAKSLLKEKKIVSPEDVENIELANCVLNDMRQAIQSTKTKRSDDARSSINVISASINGPNSAEKKVQKKIARKLGLPVRRISNGKRIRHRVLTSEKSAWTETCRKTRSDKLSDLDREKAYNFWTDTQNSRPTENKNDIKRVRTGPKLYSSHMIHVLNEIIPTTFCTNTENNTECINRECNQCGVHLLRLHPEECDMSDTAPQVTWSKYEYVSINIKKNKEIKKLCLVKKTTAPGELFSYFRHLLVSFPSHQFRANWQTTQMKTLLENLPINDCICIHDFSENFSCIEKNELQSSYFQKIEVSIHVTVIHRHSILEYDGVESTEDMPSIVTEHVFVVSPDLNHDQHFTYAVQVLVSEYLKSISYQTSTMHEFTDGCQSQYKSRHCMGSVARACGDLGYITLIRNYFETSHGKGPQDAAGGCFKRQAETAVIRGAETIQSAKDLYVFGKKKLEQPSETAQCKRRHFRYIEAVSRETQRRFKPIPKNRTIHQIIATGNPSKLFTRKLSCYTCDKCRDGNYQACINLCVGKTTTIKVVTESADELEIEEEEEETVDNLCQPNSILALFTDDSNEDYYLFKAQSQPETLKRKTKDKWGATYERGVEVIRGVYFEAVDGVLNYRLIYS